MINLRNNKIKTLSIKKLVIASLVFCVSVLTAEYARAADINYKTTVKDASGTKVQTGTDSTANLTGAKLDPAVNEKAKSAEAGAQKAVQDTAKSADAEAKDVNYSGLYNGKEIVPNIMAIYCKTNAEEFLADPTKMDRCIQKYIAAMNSRNAAAREEGLNDYNNLLLRVLMKMMSEAVAKGASTANYDDVANKTAEKTAQTETIHEDGAGISYTTSLSTDVINRLRELSVTTLFWQVVQGMRFVDPSIIDEEIREEAEAQAANNIIKDNSPSKGQDAQLNVSTEATLGYGDKTYTNEEEDLDGGVLENANVVATSPIEQFKQMSAEEFAQNKDRFDRIKQGALKFLDTPDITAEEIANTKRQLEEMDAIEKAQAVSSVATQYPTPWNGGAQEQPLTWNNLYPNNQSNENVQVPYRPADSNIDEEDNRTYKGRVLNEVIVTPTSNAQATADSTQYSAPWNGGEQKQPLIWNNIYPNNQSEENIQVSYRPADSDIDEEVDEYTYTTPEQQAEYDEKIRGIYQDAERVREQAVEIEKGTEADAVEREKYWQEVAAENGSIQSPELPDMKGLDWRKSKAGSKRNRDK
ncbi:MAG: hypothetical protein IJ778_03420 [Alphaproteobacteria bacterium]|nr:hypothetical protein [Alphaproteobacteria bacterium]